MTSETTYTVSEGRTFRLQRIEHETNQEDETVSHQAETIALFRDEDTARTVADLLERYDEALHGDNPE